MSSVVRAARTLGLALLLAACSQPPLPIATPGPTPFPTHPPEAAGVTVARWVAAWRTGDYEAMWSLIASADRKATPMEAFATLHGQFAELVGLTDLRAELPRPEPASLPPQVQPALDPQGDDSPAVAEGPVPALSVRTNLRLTTDRFGHLTLVRRLFLTQEVEGWRIRWRQSTLFAEIDPDATLELDRTLGRRGRIVAGDGTVFAQTRDDGARVYPQEWLAGQLIGYVSPITDEELEILAAEGYESGELVGRSGLEAGAEDLLRGQPGIELVAAWPDGRRESLLERRMVPGADLTITIRPEVQRAAETAMSRYATVATAAVDPRSGDVLALASLPRFNPNAMTIGTTLAGQALSRPASTQITNRALLGAYPTGSAFKVFTLAAALRGEVVTAATRMACPPTWTYSGFTFRNFMNHSLAGLVGFDQSMAFSCNTTYMPLSIRVYENDQRTLAEVIGQFGFGAPTGIRHVDEADGRLPDHDYFATTPRGNGALRPYGPFDQIQLSIGQGELLSTPLQLASAYAAIGNGGTLWRPRLVERATLPNGGVLAAYEAEPIRQVDVAPQHLAYVISTMEAVVNYSYGTARSAFAGFPIQIAGKTGTAETGGPNPHAWFAAVAPSSAPTIAVATVVVSIPLGTGGDFAAPLVRQILAAHLFP